MNQRQWQEVESIVRNAQERALQHLNNKRYDELTPILDELYKLAHQLALSSSYYSLLLSPLLWS